MINISCDVHTHSLFSRHAYSTVEEDVRAASEQGFELLGITDHFSDMLFDEPTFKNFQFFINLEVWPREWHGVRLLRGCEADIVDLDGNLYGHDIELGRGITGKPLRRPRMLKEMAFRNCDYVVASVHEKGFTEDATPAQNALMYIRALEDPKVLILGHLGRSGVDFEVDPVVEAARDMGKLIEINEASLKGRRRSYCHDRCRHILERCAELGCMVSFASDAHISADVARCDESRALLEEIDFPQELMACRDASTFVSVLSEAVGAPEP